MQPLPPNSNKRNSLPWHVRRRQRLLMSFSVLSFCLIPVIAAANASSAFGRFDQGLSNCQLEHNQTKQACGRVQISAIGADGLRIRFFGVDTTSKTSHQLTFVANNPTGTSPLACHYGHCKLNATPWNGTVTSTSWTTFDHRGLPKTAPHALKTSGSCTFDASTIHCASRSRRGDTAYAKGKR